MADLTSLSDQELNARIAQAQQPSSNDLSKLSDDELNSRIAAAQGSQPKPFYDAIGANMTPQMKQDHPVLAGIEQTAQDVGTVAEKGINGITLGGLDYGLGKAGIQPPNFDNTAPENKSGLNVVGDVANLGGAGKTIGTLAKGATLIPGVKQGIAAVGDVANNAKTKLFDLAKANQQLKNPEKMAQDVRASLLSPVTGQKAQIGKNFETLLNNLISSKPYDTVNLQEPVSSMRSAMDDVNTNPGLSSQIKSVIRTIKNPDAAKMLNEIIDDPSKAANLTLKQSQDLKVAIQNSPSIRMKLAQGRFANYTQGDLELLDLLDNVKLKQSENFPELADIRKPYADYMQQYNQVKNKFKPGQLEGNIKNGFGDSEIEGMVKRILPDATNKQIDSIRQVLALKKAGKWGAGLAGVGSADAIIRKVTGQ